MAFGEDIIWVAPQDESKGEGEDDGKDQRENRVIYAEFPQ